MIKILIIILFISSSFCFADSDIELDIQLKKIGLVDQNYKIINKEEYINYWEFVSKNMVKMLPMELSRDSRIITTKITKDLYFSILQIDVAGTDYEIEQPYLNASKSNFCNLSFGKSKVIRANGGITVVLMVVNYYYQMIYQYRFSSLECPH